MFSEPLRYGSAAATRAALSMEAHETLGAPGIPLGAALRRFLERKANLDWHSILSEHVFTCGLCWVTSGVLERLHMPEDVESSGHPGLGDRILQHYSRLLNLDADSDPRSKGACERMQDNGGKRL
jgi:hypothetical protein